MLYTELALVVFYLHFIIESILEILNISRKSALSLYVAADVKYILFNL